MYNAPNIRWFKTMLVSRLTIRRICLLILLSSTAVLQAQQRPRVLLAVFAHPDDEGVVGPVLARYEHEGARVYLAIATKGEKGAFPHSGIPAGDQLAKVRHEEAICACRQLGIDPPIFFDLNDGEIGAISRPLAQNVQAVADKFEKLLAELNPDVIVTWGPDGGYGHPDHRLVSAAVTQVVQSRKSAVRLLYVGFSGEDVKLLDDVGMGVHWHATDPNYLSVRIPVTKRDQVAALQSLECHKSQFSPEEMKKLRTVVEGRSIVWFRQWFSDRKSDDLFK
jgi:LmbE family N-acetylglucosaminyl deacetylase